MPVNPGVALAGRVGELERATRHLTGASDAVALLIVGEAGIGKSRLVAAAADAAAAAARGTTWSAGRSPALSGLTCGMLFP